MCIKLFPGYHPKDFPLVIAKREFGISIINTAVRSICSIAECSDDTSCCKCDRINFVEDRDFTVVTSIWGNRVCKFWINPAMLDFEAPKNN